MGGLPPDTPSWLLVVIVIVLLIPGIAPFVWGTVLEMRYTAPYTLYGASSRQKWRRALIVTFWQTLAIPWIGLIEPFLSAYPDQWPGFPLFCTGIWVIVFPIGALYWRARFEFELRRYLFVDRTIKKGTMNRFFSSPFVSWPLMFMDDERKRFFAEGYPEDNPKVREESENHT